MSSVSFSFSAESSEEDRTAALQQIGRWPGVKAVGLVKADAKNPVVRRMATLVLDSSGVASEVIGRLGQLPAVEQASIPARRGLSSGGAAEAPSKE